MGILLDDAVSIATSNSYRNNRIIGDAIYNVNSGIRTAATHGFTKYLIQIAQTVNEIPSEKFRSYNTYYYLHIRNMKLNKFKSEIIDYYKNEGFDVSSPYRNIIEISWERQTEEKLKEKERNKNA